MSCRIILYQIKRRPVIRLCQIFQPLVNFHADILIIIFAVQGFVKRERRLVFTGKFAVFIITGFTSIAPH